MHRAIQIIEDEHRNVEAALFSLQALVREVGGANATRDFKVFHGILTYIDSFLDFYHHPKENIYLFPALCERYPKAEKLVHELKDQHREGANLLNRIYKALSRYEFQGPKAFGAFLDATETYVTFERDHAAKEERELLPLVREHLTEQDWRPIDAAFSDHEDPLFGDTPRAEYQLLLHRIMSMTPPPHGA
ncbi:MAG: hemerythrin domain-containing protein, partial [Gammaproteobacteria bacterium]|nr:hemerythrin domain-containing protein [Gammaproteobacteria bacterium]NIR82421.1 hemerythrin domain-containing protein [Gammaproteobacteria bacterium]NIR92002.1 hemerythrin domain-containing protein [Gammaproteobacteria bacterium]NIU03558.1 hemerythrin domain-containing protein [Gammaproteobacteria bacterium]NIX84832.1 hypothetical protein [Gammaproteobacteria bacterium]